MSITKEQREAILEFGETKYSMGYKDGYISGIISGVLLATITFTIFTMTKKV